MSRHGVRSLILAIFAIVVLALRQLAQSSRPIAVQSETHQHGQLMNRTAAKAVESKSKLAHLKQIEQGEGSKITVFVHFHKAAGTSVVSAFLKKKTPWEGHHNGNPWDVRGGKPYIVEFWKYDSAQFHQFLREAQREGVEFIAMEWNFFEQFTTDHLKHISLVTCVRDPYDRFVSNLFFEDFDPKFVKDPSLFVAINFTKELGRVIDGKYKLDSNYPVNFNKPNFYVAFMNGMANDRTYDRKLNRTHLEIAKERLALFDAVFILERPETFQHWLPEMQGVREREGKARKRIKIEQKAGKTRKKSEIALTREQFYLDNALDLEFYEYALNLSLSRT